MQIFAVFILGILFIELLRHVLGFHSFLRRDTKRWIAFDFDGTLAHHLPGPFNAGEFGEPYPEIVELAKKYLDDGVNVKVLTARVATNGTLRSVYEALLSRYYLRKWTKKHIGRALPIVEYKNYKMNRFYDDRAVRVHEGSIVGEDLPKF